MGNRHGSPPGRAAPGDRSLTRLLVYVGDDETRVSTRLSEASTRPTIPSSASCAAFTLLLAPVSELRIRCASLSAESASSAASLTPAASSASSRSAAMRLRHRAYR